ncbi:hypothetical protein MB02_07515 [Croceicoccus estronivorus]|uniref:TonB-dependent siderophore receptor n=1 Tax=Croceicoccus estronivorus TaxID=1172626 RepID=UPI000837113F|nr:TonB-dependent receptor [Croceicoccus estronivorus]OCC24418.1 hypothetical protein MB02_07515 [Croceicoccus estronivorus]
MRLTKHLLACASSIAMLGALPAHAQEDPSTEDGKTSAQETVRDDTALQAIVVTGRRLGITNVRPTATVSGLEQDIVDIPRSVTTIDSALLKDVQVRSIHDLTAVAPGTFTAAYFGVAGAVQVRGNVADSYYRGFKGINNLGYYETPTESISGLELVRGPVSPNYGAGKIGGMLNLTPKTDIATSLKGTTEPKGLVTLQIGSYGERKATIEGGLPFQIGDLDAAIYAYVYYNNSDSYFRDFSPDDKEVQVGYSMDLGGGTEMTIGGRYLDQSGHLASPGWNRLTQDLIDHGTYLAGSPLVNLAPDGAQSLMPEDMQPYINTLRQSTSFATDLPRGTVSDLTRLDPDTVHYVKLSRRNLHTSPLDFNDNKVFTAYLDLIHTFDSGDQVKLQGFYEDLKNDMFSAAGSSTAADGNVKEVRLSYFFKRDLGDGFGIQAIVGGNYRDYEIYDYQNYGRRYVIWDRNDLSADPTADMIINDQYLNPAGNVWDFAYYSRIKSVGAFINGDITLFDRAHIQGGLRWDDYNIRSRNDGLVTFGGALNTDYYGSSAPISWQASFNYELPFGFIPYVTYAKTRSLETNKGGGVDPALIIGKKFLSPSELKEVGIKGSLMGGRLFLSLAGYKMKRLQRDALSGVINQARSKGLEAEIRMQVTPALSLLATGALQETKRIGSATILLNAAQLGLPGEDIYAAEWTGSSSTFTGANGSYIDSVLPKETASLFATYKFPFGLKASGGITYVGKTSGIAPGAVVVPDYVTARASLSYTFDRYTVDFSVENLTDKTYFYLGQDAYSEVAALPGVARSFHLRIAAQF